MHQRAHMPSIFTHARIASSMHVHLLQSLRLKMSCPKLTQFEVGQIIALHRQGYAQRDIASEVVRSSSGASAVTFGAVGQTIRHWNKDPSWTGATRKLEAEAASYHLPHSNLGCSSGLARLVSC